MITVTKRFRFEAAHYLPNYIGSCARLHGHTYKLEVTFGPVDDKTVRELESGMIIDFKIISELVMNNVLARYDHAYLNELNNIPTAENILLDIVALLQNVSPIPLYKVKLWETHNSYATWSKE